MHYKLPSKSFVRFVFRRKFIFFYALFKFCTHGLVKLVKENFNTATTLENRVVSRSQLAQFEIEDILLETILFQTGYLTIKSYDVENELYTLDYPNREITQSFSQLTIAAVTNTSFNRAENAARKLVAAIKQNDLIKFFANLESLLAHVTYHQRLQEEAYYHALFQLLGTLLGFNLQSEVLTDKGRIDLVLTTLSHVYIFEIKHSSSADEALKQIEDRKYYQRYALKDKKIVLVGVSCNDSVGPTQIEWKARYL